MFEPWYERLPERLDRELQALEKASVDYVLDEEAKRERQVIVLHLKAPGIEEGKAITVEAVYPDSFPYFRPLVSAPDLTLHRHQDPFTKDVCLLRRSTQEWDPERTLADLLYAQLPKAIAKGRVTDPEAIAADEEEQDELFSAYYPYEPKAVVLIDSAFEILPSHGQEGKLVIGFPKKSSVQPKAALLEIQSNEGELIHQLPEELVAGFTRRVEGRWYYLEEPLRVSNADGALQALKDMGRRVPRPKDVFNVTGGKMQDVIGIAFPEEGSGTGWVFVVRVKDNKPRKHPSKKTRSFFVRAERAGPGDLRARIPELAPLSGKTVSLVGLGCVGAPVALELAKAGISTLRLMDYDIVSAANSVRWPLGFTYVGWPKPHALQSFIQRNYPYTQVEPYWQKIGAVRKRTEGDPEWQLIQRFVKGTSMIIDASAEEGVNNYLSALARELGIPYLYLYGTRGGFGGLVARIVPGETEGCWMCLQHAQFHSDSLHPPEDVSGEVQPLGCDDPTFTGSSFDLSTISLAAVRVAGATLCSTEEAGYPNVDWDVGVVTLRDEAGKPCAPIWETSSIERHPDCYICASHST